MCGTAKEKLRRRLPRHGLIRSRRYSSGWRFREARLNSHAQCIALFGPSAPRVTLYLSAWWRCRGRVKREELPSSIRNVPSGDFLPTAIRQDLRRGTAISWTARAVFSSVGFARHTASACDTTWSCRSPACAPQPACRLKLRATRARSRAAPVHRAAVIRQSAAAGRPCRTADSLADRPRAE
jgi:hypothetical protein